MKHWQKRKKLLRNGGLTIAEKEYIERKVIINKIVNTPTVPIRQCYEGNFVYADGVSGRQNEIIDYINEQPTADVAPVRHGYWYNRGGRFRCSVCDNKALLKDIGGTGGWSHEYEQQKSPYCPNCGARMDEQ